MTDIFSGLTLLLDSRPEARTSGLARSVFLQPQVLVPAVQRLLTAGYHLEDVSGLDAAEGFLITYHFNQYYDRSRLALRALVPHAEAHLPSIAAIYQGAEWHEREVKDFFGIRFDGNPNTAALLLPEEDESAPLRKEQSARRPLRERRDPGTIVQRLPSFELFGPQPQP